MPTLANAAKISLRLDVPIETFNAYDTEGRRLKRGAEDVMAQQLARYQYLAVDEQPLVLSNAEREELEEILGPTPSGAALLTRLKAGAEMTLHGVKIQFEPWQLAELKRRAEKNGTTQKQEIEKAVQQAAGLMFQGLGGV